MNTPTVLLAASHTRWQWRGVNAITLGKKTPNFCLLPNKHEFVCVSVCQNKRGGGHIWIFMIVGQTNREGEYL